MSGGDVNVKIKIKLLFHRVNVRVVSVSVRRVVVAHFGTRVYILCCNILLY